jgi:hypothetical protein
MGRIARNKQVDPDEIGYYHCYSRCVRGQYLIGYNDRNGQKDEHRKGWIEELQAKLLTAFAMELIGFAILDNHMHHVIRTRPDLAAQWSDAEVVIRWRRIHPLLREDGSEVEMTDELIAAQLENRAEVAEWRKRLRDLSWFMKELKEPIAKRANEESGVTGPFWNGRFKSPRLLDAVALLLCLLYVDLNPVRACLADTPENSRYTSVRLRIVARQQRLERGGQGGVWPQGDADAYLIPICEGGEAGNLAAPHFRLTDQGVLPLTLDQYLEMLDWTGRQCRPDKRGAIPGGVAPILDRLGVDQQFWLQAAAHFGNPSHTFVGRPEAMRSAARRAGLATCHGISASRQVLQDPSADQAASDQATGSDSQVS